jgi:hypothetical protein
LTGSFYVILNFSGAVVLKKTILRDLPTETLIKIVYPVVALPSPLETMILIN